ncbi:hypothetical protein LG198_00005, partial [Methylobacillus arboreus]|uniref:hypothetical protein n=1 Tax=Methylobacillus arboreus TaxID=755170 RepID=UPI001E527E85
TQTIRYATQSPSAQWATGTLAQLKPATNATRDQTTYRLYNAQGQLIGEVDAESYLTEYTYDLGGNVLNTMRYASKVTYTAGNTLGQIRPAASNDESQVISTAYDANNRLIAIIDQKRNVLTSHTYDNVGRLVSTTTVDLATYTMRTQSRRYDLQGRVIAELNGEGNKALQALGSSPTQAQIDNIWNNYGIRYEYDAAGQ